MEQTTVKLENIERQSSVKQSVIQGPQSQHIVPVQDDFKASEYIRRPDPFDDRNNIKFDGFYSLQ